MARTKSQAIIGLEQKGVKVEDDQLDVEPVTQDPKLHLKEVAALEKFMAEHVTVLVMATTDANAPPYCDLSVNGMKAIVRRNVPTTIRRMHLEVLARMKETRWVQPPVEGTKAVGMESLQGHTAHAYPFQVIEDKNPKGAPWLQHILAEPA